jgi:hypothetical protein
MWASLLVSPLFISFNVSTNMKTSCCCHKRLYLKQWFTPNCVQMMQCVCFHFYVLKLNQSKVGWLYEE